MKTLATIGTGDTLPNGAKVLDVDMKAKKVLALRLGTYEPYVIWTIDHDLNCYWGHYFGDGVTAFNNWAELEEREAYSN